MRGQFELGFAAFIVEQDAVTGIGEPDCAVAGYDEIIGSIQTLA